MHTSASSFTVRKVRTSIGLFTVTGTLLLTLLLVLNTDCILAQEKGESPADAKAHLTPGKSVTPEYNALKWRFPAGNIFAYTMHDSTEVLRTYSDSSTLKYSRDVTYYLELRANSDPVNGMLELDVNIDSLRYRFKSGESEIVYDNRSKVQLKFPDLTAATVPVNRECFIKFSPYWEAVSIRGEMLDWLKDYIAKYGEGHLDSMSTYMWLNGISTMAYAQIIDPQKGVLPNDVVKRDSSWKKPYFVKIDGLDCRDDSATTHIASYALGLYTLESDIQHLKVLPKTDRLYGIERMIDILGGEGKGHQTLVINRRGNIISSSSQFNTTVKAHVRNETFSENVQSFYTWISRGLTEY